jgi:flagellar hook-length control protein FliK
VPAGTDPAQAVDAPEPTPAAPHPSSTGVATEAAPGAPAAKPAVPQGGTDSGRREQHAPGSQHAPELAAAHAVAKAQESAATAEHRLAAATREPVVDSTAPTAATQSAETVQPVVTPAAAQTLGVERPGAETPVRAHSNLAQLAQTARTVVRVAVREGATSAHITLHPAELGEVQIRLRYHAGGVSADVLADSPAAAQALQQASAELRRALESQGVVVHDLDVRQGEQEERRALKEHQGHAGHGRRRAHHDDYSDHTTIDTSSLPLATGAVDVLA